MSTTSDLAKRSKARARTVTWQQISGWQFDNQYILSGYRPEEADYLKVISSLTFLHNETCNVYTHLVGALLLPLVATVFLRHLAEPQFLNVSYVDYAMFGIYFWCAEICLVLSAFYHLIQSHSHRLEQFWHGMDLLGIVIVTLGTFSSGIYYVFFCEPNLQKAHWAIVSFLEQLSWLVLPAVRSDTLTLIPDSIHGHCHQCYNLKSVAWHAALAGVEGRRLRWFWHFIAHTPAPRSPTIRVRTYAPVLGNEVVYARTYLLWHWSRPVRCMSTHRARSIHLKTRILTNICSSGCRSVWHLAALIFGEAHTRSSM